MTWKMSSSELLQVIVPPTGHELHGAYLALKRVSELVLPFLRRQVSGEAQSLKQPAS